MAILPLITCLAAALWASAVQWSTAQADAVARSKESGKPILMDFQAPWCYSCYYMERRVLSGEKFASAAAAVVPLRLDVDEPEGQALKAAHAVTFLPTFVVLEPGGGKERGRIIGEQTESDFLERLSAILARRGGDDSERLAIRAKLAKGDGQALDWLLDRPVDCQTPYDVMAGAVVIEKTQDSARSALLGRQKEKLEALARARLWVAASQRCADFRSGVEALAGVYEKLGDAAAARELYAKAVARLEEDRLAIGDDRSHDDNRRHFLELKGDDAGLRAFFEKLIAAYPADYVYAYRFAKYLFSRQEAAQALSWIERADKLAYGANRLMVTNVRAKILGALGKKQEAVALLKRDLKAARAHFPKEAKSLDETLAAMEPTVY